MSIEISRFKGPERVETIGSDDNERVVLTLSPESDCPLLVTAVGVVHSKHPQAFVGYFRPDDLNPANNAIGPRSYSFVGIAEPERPVLLVDATTDEAISVSFT